MAKKNSAASTAKAHPGGNHRKRLREKFCSAGITALHDYEVVEFLLTYAIARKDVKPFAKELIKKCGGLAGVFEADAKTLTSVNGVGPGAALLLGLIRGVAKEYLKEKPGSVKRIKNARDAVNFIKATANVSELESLLALYFNAQNEVLGTETLLMRPPGRYDMRAGTVIKNAFRYNARSVMVAHLLPDEPAVPNQHARVAAEELERALSTIDILLHDYLVISQKDYFSARENGWLKA